MTKKKDYNTYILKQISKELTHLDNMKRRVKTMSNCYKHRSYIEKILIQIDDTVRAFKVLKDRVIYEEAVRDIFEEGQ